MIEPPVWALVPVRSGTGKQRLAGVLDAGQRRALVMAMAEDVLAALAATPAIAGIALVTTDEHLAALGRRYGARIIEDGGQGGLNGALLQAAGQVAGWGARSLLIVHGDVPMATPPDFEALFAGHAGGVTIARAASDGGTNALLLTPPGAIPFRFGGNSCAQHLAEAEKAGIPAAVLAIPGLSYDIDRPEDLQRLAAAKGRAARLVRAAARPADGGNEN